MLVCIQPLSQYKKKDLYRHVDSFELADPKLFEDATISNNLCICSIKKLEVNRYTLDNMELASFDKAYTIYYMYNMNNYDKYGLALKTMSYKKPEDFDIDKDFWESSRCVHHAGGGGGGFGNEGGGYKWNMLHDNSSVNAGICAIHFDTKQMKDNFCKWWYKDYKLGMACKVIHGLNLISTGPSTRFAIPQIDWSNIHINQKELWDKGLYDEAVLSEMGLKWNADKTVIVKDE